MRKLIALVTLLLVGVSFTLSAQSSEREKREAERAERRAQEKAEEMGAYQEAIQALKANRFVLEADRVIFSNGQTAFVTANTNFVLVNGQRGTVQVAFNIPNPGPNGIGGVTVDGSVSDMEMKMNDKGTVNASFNIQGIGISAQIFITLIEGNNNATVTVSPNFNSNTLTLSGSLLPISQSEIFKGTSF